MNMDLNIDIVEMFRYSKISETFTKSETIFKQGSYADKMYVILEGDIDIQVDGRNVASLSPGHILGEMALVDNLPRSAAAIAKTDCKLVPVDRESFLYIVKEHPQFALFIIKDISNKLRDLNQRVAG